MSRYEEFWKGVEARREGLPCPADCSEPFERGYGMEFAAEHARPPIRLEDEVIPYVEEWR